MHHRELGAAGVDVSEIGFGAWTVGTDWWGDRTDEEAKEMLRYALDQGITYFDTGDVYGHGHSEELVGDALGDVRDEVTVATKVGYDFYNNPQAGHGELPKEMHPEYLDDALEQSLDRLGFDHVDLLQLHNANVDEIDADVLEWLDEVKESGRADAVGIALGPSIGWLAEGETAIREAFDSVQLVWNALEPDIGDRFLEVIEETGSETSLVPRVPHSSGLLNEQITPDNPPGEGDHRAYRPDEWFETGFEKVEKLRFLEGDGVPASEASGRQGATDGSDRERTLAQGALQYLLYHDAVATITPTFRTREDIDAWAAASDVPPLTDAEYERVRELQTNDFYLDRDDGMDSLRSSVGGDDIERAGLDKHVAGD